MKVSISSSSRKEIDDYYCSIARSVSNYLAHNDFDLIYGGCSTSMMGVCYDEFKKNGRKIYVYTTELYTDDLKNLEYDDCEVCKTTFDLKKRMFYDSDVVIALPGGPGTLSEMLAFIEEKRSNEQYDKLLIVYDEDHFYDKVFAVLNEMIEKKFVGKNIYDFFYIAHNKEEFASALDTLFSKNKR